MTTCSIGYVMPHPFVISRGQRTARVRRVFLRRCVNENERLPTLRAGRFSPHTEDMTTPMSVEPTPIPGLLVIQPKYHTDARGAGYEHYRESALDDLGAAST